MNWTKPVVSVVEWLKQLESGQNILGLNLTFENSYRSIHLIHLIRRRILKKSLLVVGLIHI